MTITCKFNHNTFLKNQVLDSGELKQNEKAFCRADGQVEAFKIYPARNQHLKLHLVSPLAAMDGSDLGVVYAYEPHLDLSGDRISPIKLPVPHFRQNNNDTTYHGQGWRQCNLTSNSMLVDFLLQGGLSGAAQEQGFNEPESLYGQTLHNYGDTIDHGANTRALKDFGIESYFSHTLSEEDVIDSLLLEIPVVCGFAYKASGHICVIVGHDPDRKVWLVHDPYGTRHGSSDNYDVGVGGDFDAYSYDTMQRIFWDMGGEAGWGRVVTAINGNPTGLKEGL